MPGTIKRRGFNWKAQDQSGKPKTLLTAFTRQSIGNDGMFPPNMSQQDLMQMLEANRIQRSAIDKERTKRPNALKGLFGGG